MRYNITPKHLALMVINIIIVWLLMSNIYNFIIMFIISFLVFMGLLYFENILIFSRHEPILKRKQILNKRKSIWNDRKE